MSTMFQIYGDESIIGNDIAYGLVIVPVDKLEFAEVTLGNVKEKFKASRSARFHCREVFHKDARRKTEWAHLSDKKAFDLALAITSSLAGIGLLTRVGHIVREAVHEIPGVGGLPSMSIQDSEQLIPFAYQAAVGQMNFDEEYAGHCKLWIEPNSGLVSWFGSRKQVGRLLQTNRVNFEARTIENVMLPENLESKCRPMLLELADLLAYCSCRAIANSRTRKNRYSDRVIEAIYRSMNPVVAGFRPIDPTKSKESQLIDFAFVGQR